MKKEKVNTPCQVDQRTRCRTPLVALKPARARIARKKVDMLLQVDHPPLPRLPRLPLNTSLPMGLHPVEHPLPLLPPAEHPLAPAEHPLAPAEPLLPQAEHQLPQAEHPPPQEEHPPPQVEHPPPQVEHPPPQEEHPLLPA